MIMYIVFIIVVAGIASLVTVTAYGRAKGSRTRRNRREMAMAAPAEEKSRHQLPETAELVLIPPEIIAFLNDPETDNDLTEELLSIASNTPFIARASIIQDYLKEIKEFDDEF